MKKNIQIITVVNNFDIFDAFIKKNAYMSRYHIYVFDNTVDNIGIPLRYNHFLENDLHEEGWLVFCHQDFSFLEDIHDRLEGLSKDFIYGPIGAVNRKGIFFKSWRPRFHRKVLLGQINQSDDAVHFYKNGRYLKRPVIVNTVDCCCLIVHSSLIKKHNLRFDKMFKFHLYSEDFSLNARYNCSVKTKAVQIECKHSSRGNTSKEFYNALENLKRKYPNKRFVGTCFH